MSYFISLSNGWFSRKKWKKATQTVPNVLAVGIRACWLVMISSLQVSTCTGLTVRCRLCWPAHALYWLCRAGLSVSCELRSENILSQRNFSSLYTIMLMSCLQDVLPVMQKVGKSAAKQACCTCNNNVTNCAHFHLRLYAPRTFNVCVLKHLHICNKTKKVLFLLYLAIQAAATNEKL